jgi:hypothetical protein
LSSPSARRQRQMHARSPPQPTPHCPQLSHEACHRPTALHRQGSKTGRPKKKAERRLASREQRKACESLRRSTLSYRLPVHGPPWVQSTGLAGPSHDAPAHHLATPASDALCRLPGEPPSRFPTFRLDSRCCSFVTDHGRAVSNAASVGPQAQTFNVQTSGGVYVSWPPCPADWSA